MNSTLKTILALGAAGMSLLTLAGSAGAASPDPSLTLKYSTIKSGTNPLFGAGPTTLGVGYDPTNPKIPSSQGVAQSLYEAFNFDTSAAGAFTTIAAGSKAQIELFGTSENVNTDPNTGAHNPFNVYVGLFAYDAAATVPVTGPDLFGSLQQVTLVNGGAGSFSAEFTTAGAVLANEKYVLAITTLNSDTQDFGTVSTAPFSLTGIPTGSDQTLAKSKYATNNDDQGNPTSLATTFTGNNAIAFRLSAAPAAVPEASTSLGFGLGLGVLGMALGAAKLRRSVAR